MSAQPHLLVHGSQVSLVGLALVVCVGSKAALVGQPRLQHTDAEGLNSHV